MSSFVPSAHILSQSIVAGSAQVSYSKLPPGAISSVAEHGQLALESYRQTVTNQDYQSNPMNYKVDESASSRRQNLQNMDKNFNQLMEQNQRLE